MMRRTLKLRDFEQVDFDRLCKIDRRCFSRDVAYNETDMEGFLRRRGSLAIVGENTNREVVAFVLAQKLSQERAHIITLDVLPGYRRRGAGRELMRLMEKKLCAAGIRTVRLETAVANQRAQALYRSLGYTFVRRLRQYYANGEDAWLMEKNLVCP